MVNLVSPILPDNLVCLSIENIRVTGRMTGCLVNQGTEKKNTEWKLQAMSWTAWYQNNFKIKIKDIFHFGVQVCTLLLFESHYKNICVNTTWLIMATPLMSMNINKNVTSRLKSDPWWYFHWRIHYPTFAFCSEDPALRVLVM